MFLNSILSLFHKFLSSVYENSFFLKHIDTLIGINIFLVILSSIVCNSDYIGYFAIFAIILTFIKLITKPDEEFKLQTADKFLLMYFIFVLISLAGSSLFYLSLKGFLKTITYLGFYVSLIHYFKANKDKIKYIFIAFAVCASIETIFAFIQNFASVSEISGWQDTTRLNPEEVMTRVYGTLKPYNPNLFGGYMLTVLPAFIGIFDKHKLWAIIGGITSATAIIFTGCRGAYIGLFFEILIFLLILYRFMEPKFKKVFISFTSVAVTFLSVIILSMSALRARIFSIFAMRGDSSNSFRFNVYHSCIDMFKDNWLLGIGVGNQNFREIYGLYMKTGFDALSAYNIYLETAVESGIFALITFVCFVYFQFKKAFKHINSIYVLASVIALVGILIHGFVDTVFFRPQIQFAFWIMMSVITVSDNISQKKSLSRTQA